MHISAKKGPFKQAKEERRKAGITQVTQLLAEKHGEVQSQQLCIYSIVKFDSLQSHHPSNRIAQKPWKCCKK
jgi:hypothetical protein